METKIITDIDAFMEDWNKAQSTLTEREQDIITSVALQHETRTKLAKRYSISNERARQIADSAVTKFLRELRSPDQSTVLEAIDRLQYTVDAAGILGAFSLGRDKFDQSDKVTAQLVNIGVVSPEDSEWALAVVHLLPRPHPSRPSLKGLVPQVRSTVGRHHLGATPEHVLSHQESWKPAIAAWPNFDIALHVKAVTGITPDPDTGRYHPVNGWPVTSMTPAYRLRHHVSVALAEADRCLTISEITERANSIAEREGFTHNYNPRRIAAILGSNDQYRWVANATYGLATWDIGHSGETRLNARRTNLAAEIVYLLGQSPEPLPVSVIKDHVAKRFRIADGTIDTVLNRHNGQEFIIDENRNVRLAPREQP